MKPHNAVYFTSSKTKSDLCFYEHYSLSFVSRLFSSSNYAFSSLTSSLPEYVENVNHLSGDIQKNCKNIDQLQTTMYRLSLGLFLEHKISSDTRALLENPFYDSFERWIYKFKNAFENLQKVLVTTNVTETNEIQYYFENLNEMLSLLLRETNNIIKLEEELSCESSVFHSYLLLDTLITRKKSQELENLLKSTYAKLTQLWPETLCLAKTIWYEYERDCVLEKLQNSKGVESSFFALTKKKDAYSGNILYVNRSFIGGNGSITAPFYSIQDALDVAKTNDTIRVYPGVYTEKLLIETSICLEGVDKKTTIIDGQKTPQHTVFVTADYVTITGFTIRNSSIKRYSCGICVYSSYNTISGNVFTQNFIGYGMGQAASYNLISNNDFYNNSFIGAAVDESQQTKNHFSNNLFYDNPHYGLFLLNSKTLVEDNRFVNDGITISLDGQPLQIMFENNTINNLPLLCFQNESFITLNEDEIGSLILVNCSSSTITDYRFCDADTSVYLINCENISITKCSFDRTLNGIITCYSKNITIAENDFQNINDTSIIYQFSSKGTIQHNSISHNRVGLYSFDSFQNQILNNTITNNDVGVSLWSQNNNHNVGQNNIENNVFMNNNQHAYATAKNNWINNYFDDWLGLNNRLFKKIPYFISGRLGKNIDFHPALEP